MTEMNSIYSSEIEKISLLTLEEEKTLAAKAFSGDKKAQNKLVEANLKFVIKIANKYRNYMDIDDLVMEGNLGLIHAAEKFNPDNGNRFITYAAFWIKAYIQKAIRETSTGIKFPARNYEDMKSSKWQISSLDKIINNGEDGETTLSSFLKDDKTKNPEDMFVQTETEQKLNELLETLKDNEKTVLTRRYGLDGKKCMSLSEIGTLMDYSKERIRQIEKKALMKLQNNIAQSSGYDGLAA